MRKNFERGGAGIAVFLILLLLIGWAGFRVGQLYFDKSSIENEIAVLGDEALTTHVDVKPKIEKILNNYGAAYDPEKIGVEFNPEGNRVTISLSYSRNADLGVTQVPKTFDVHIEREGAKAVGIIQHVQDSVGESYNNSAQKYEKAVKAAVPRQTE